MPARMPTVHESDLDGLTTFWVDAPAPLYACLSFRCGAWDESLFSRGISHLGEHVALHPLRNLDHQYNGLVDGLTTSFWATGNEAQVTAFFEAVVAQLRSLAVDRIET